MTPPTTTRRTFVTGAAAATLLAASRAGASAAAPPPPPGLRPGTTPAGDVGRDGPWVPAPEVLAALPRLLALSGVPGTALAVVEAGRLAWTHGAGVRYLATPADRAGSASAVSHAPSTAAVPAAVHAAPDAVPDAAANAVTADAVFEAASLGKPVFAWGVLGLVDAGALDLDRPLSAYLPLPDVVADAAARRVTARHVLSHTTGFPNWRRALGPLVPAFAPGTRFGYSGEGIYYLQRVVEHLTGRPFAAWARDAVLAPLGMRDSSYVWQAAYAGRLAEGHAADGTLGDTLAGVGRRNADVGVGAVGTPLDAWTHDDAVRALAATAPRLPPLPNYLSPNAAGSLFTTAADYARFVAHAVAAAATSARPSAPPTTARGQMFAPQVRVNGALAWGLGWGLEQEPGASAAPGGGWRYAWHWGDNGTTKNFVLADLAAQRAVVVLTNGESGFKVYERLVAAASRRDPAGLLFRLVG